MPIYDYKCSKCGKEQEIILFGNLIDKDELVCSECGNELTDDERLTGAASFKLVYNNKTDICDWNGNTTQYNRKDVNWDAGPAGLPGR